MEIAFLVTALLFLAFLGLSMRYGAEFIWKVRERPEFRGPRAVRGVWFFVMNNVDRLTPLERALYRRAFGLFILALVVFFLPFLSILIYLIVLSILH